MKRWLAVSLGIALQVGQAFTPMIKDENLKSATQTAIVAVAGWVIKKTSETNPDGTSARVPWEKRK